MARVLYLLNFVGNGGTEKYVLDLIEQVGRKNCVFVYSEVGPGLEVFQQTGVKMFQVNMTGPFDVNAAKQIKQIIQQENIDVVHANFLRENYLAILAKWLGAHCRVFWTYHVNVPMGLGIRSLNRIMTAFNHKVITVSHFMYEQLLQKGVSKSKLRLIHNGVEGPKQAQPMKSLREVPVFSVVGRLREEKGQAFLIESLDFLKKAHPELKWECHLYGDGPQHEELTELVHKLGLENFVQFKGFCAEKEIVYLNSDIVIVPSKNDAFPYVPMEALSFNRVVVGTKIGGIPEIIKHDESGLLVEYGNNEELANTLYRLLTNQELVQKLSENGRKYFEEHFTLEKMMQQTTELYEH
ncbi:glycosyltransferase [Bacillus sp. BRMEA1]|uniref:glycosyltransferase n=1 Tax=Neobacillus endophyticus TaxID=2738405 RepID=UPI001565290B|nr:glycosyltransferase [Neobacillus endophyticus]NRD76694.1 glycosyltransferase [Neobacillus endophyticus]